MSFRFEVHGTCRWWQASCLQSSLNSMEEVFVDALKERVANLQGDTLPESVSDGELRTLITGLWNSSTVTKEPKSSLFQIT